MCLFLNLRRQGMVPCEAEMSILKLPSNTSITRNFWPSSYWLETGSIFVGGLPHPHTAKQVFFFKFVLFLRVAY